MKKKYNLNPELLAVSKRGDVVENLFFGWICVVNKDKKIIYKRGDLNDYAFLRSCAKPIQAIPAAAVNVFNDSELSIVCGSHTGSEYHKKVLNKIIKKNKLNPKMLRCGCHVPFDEKERNNLIKHNLKPNVLHHNCSGKHLGMLAVCRKMKYPTENYLSSNHPLQREIYTLIRKLSECNNVRTAVDGCGLPTFALPIKNIALLFLNFHYDKIVRAMTTFPYLMGGKGQVDSEVIKLSNGKILAKVGADGIIVAKRNDSVIIIKIADGNPRARAFVFLNMLVKLGWINGKDILKSSIREMYLGEVKNVVGRKVGQLIVS